MAAISVEVSLDELRQYVPKFVNATKREVGEELLRQAKLLVRDSSGQGLLSVTPPKGLDEGQDVGQWAATRDINRVFVRKSTISAILKTAGQRGAQTAFNRYLKRGQLEKAKELINGQAAAQVSVKGYVRNGKPVKSYTQTRQASVFGDHRLGRIEHIGDVPSKMLHQQRRGKDGKVKRPQWSQIVLKKPPFNQYIADTQKKVGRLKAGWAKAAKQARLDVAIPPFIGRNVDKASGKGVASFANPLNMFVELANTTPIASSKINQGNLNYLLKLRQDNIKRELDRRLAASARKNQL
jgi:hypothetical protein